MNHANNSNPLRELIRILERKLGIIEDSQISCCSITLAQCHALVEIGRATNLSLNTLAELLNIDSSSMSRTVNNLVHRDLVKRDIDPLDRRYVTISLTENGKTLFQNIEEQMNRYFTKIYDCIPEDTRDQVINSIQILLTAISEVESINQ